MPAKKQPVPAPPAAPAVPSPEQLSRITEITDLAFCKAVCLLVAHHQIRSAPDPVMAAKNLNAAWTGNLYAQIGTLEPHLQAPLHAVIGGVERQVMACLPQPAPAAAIVKKKGVKRK